MGDKRQRSMIGKLSELLVSGSRARFLEATISPRSPLDMKIHSPRCIKNYDHAGGVGLGIVAALEKSNDSDREILGKFCVRCPIKTPSRDPIPVDDSEKSCGEIIKESFEDMEMDDLEDYTYVICHGPNQSFAKVYYDGGDESIVSVDSKVVHGGITDPILTIEEEEDGGVFPTLEYLSSCFLCGKELHGEDIYMYREKAFCSMDCRSKQIINEERKEVCRSGTPRATDTSDSPCAERKSFAAGILAV